MAAVAVAGILSVPLPVSAESRPRSRTSAQEKREALAIEPGLSGSWENADGLIRNRATFRAEASDLAFRAVADQRGSVPDDPIGDAVCAFGAYHPPTASRFVYGAVEADGLPHRVSSPFGRALPLADDHGACSVDIDGDASAEREPSLHAALGTPLRFPIRAIAALTADSDRGYVTTGTAEASGRNSSFVRLQGLCTRNELAEREPDAWFSDAPPLPVRLHRVYGVGAVASSRIAAVAGDAALSDTYAEGAGAYGNAALRFGYAPWRLCLAADGASARYRGPDGDMTGSRFRTAARIERAATPSERSAARNERSGPRNERSGVARRMELVRLDVRTSHPAATRPPDAMEAALSIRRAVTRGFGLKRAALSGEWSIDATGPLIEATECDVGLALGPAGMDGTLRTTFAAEPGLGGRLWDETVARAALSFAVGPVDIGAGFARRFGAEGRAVTEANLGASAHGKRATFGFKIGFEEVPGPASLRLFWRLRNRTVVPFPTGQTP